MYGEGGHCACSAPTRSIARGALRRRRRRRSWRARSARFSSRVVRTRSDTRQAAATHTSVTSSRPRRESVRISSADVSRPEALAVEALTRISPAPAFIASRAVVFTASPTRIVPVVARRAHEVTSGVDGSRRVILAREARNEEGDDFVADELVHEPVPLVDHLRRRPVEASYHVREILSGHVLGERCGTANVREEHRDLDLGAAWVLADGAKTCLAESPVEARRTVSDRAQHNAPRRAKRSEAELAARSGRNPADKATDRLEATHLPGQDRTPRLFVTVGWRVLLGHRSANATWAVSDSR